MIYVPDLEKYECVVLNFDYGITYIRAYEKMPGRGVTTKQVDYYIDSHYVFKESSAHWSSTSSTFPSCLPSEILTDQFYYRNDFDSILVIFFILAIVLIYFPFRIFSRIFGRWLKV